MDRIRTSPRISLNKLAEYMVTTTASRRWTLLEDQWAPKGFKAPMWKEGYAAIADVILQGYDRRLIRHYLDEWRAIVPRSKFEHDKRELWIRALLAFAAHIDPLRRALASYKFEPGLKDAYVLVSGTSVSIRPELLIAGDTPGALKLYLGKTSPLTKQEGSRAGSGTYATTVLHMWAENELNAKPAHCHVLDIFGQELFTAPTRAVRHRQQVLANCREIAGLWASLGPSGSSSGRSGPRATGPA